LWFPRDSREVLRDRFYDLWDHEFPSRNSELKWTKVSAGKLGTYKKFIDLFADIPEIDFRCTVLDTHAIDHKTFNQSDAELGFYKFMFTFISRNINKSYQYEKINEPYQLFLDRRRENDVVEVGHLADLKSYLNVWLDSRCVDIEKPVVRSVEAVDSKESPEVQLADVLLGAVGYAWEGYQRSEAKVELIRYIENHFEWELHRKTPMLSKTINIWPFQLQQQKESAPRPTPPEGG
jgi:hypothetical protein